jgi:hypothetical protein
LEQACDIAVGLQNDNLEKVKILLDSTRPVYARLLGDALLEALNRSRPRLVTKERWDKLRREVSVLIRAIPTASTGDDAVRCYDDASRTWIEGVVAAVQEGVTARTAELETKEGPSREEVAELKRLHAADPLLASAMQKIPSSLREAASLCAAAEKALMSSAATGVVVESEVALSSRAACRARPPWS